MMDLTFSPCCSSYQVPEGFETDDKIKTDLRPEQSSLDDYEQVPIEQFGLALLRGMGWKDGDGQYACNVSPFGIYYGL